MKSLTQLYDVSKMKEEDRRLIITYSSNSAMFNASSKLNNTTIFIALVSLLVAIFSLLYTFQKEFNNFVLSALIVEMIIFIYLLYQYFYSNRKVNNITNSLVNDHNHFFEYHFGYAKRK